MNISHHKKISKRIRFGAKAASVPMFFALLSIATFELMFPDSVYKPVGILIFALAFCGAVASCLAASALLGRFDHIISNTESRHG